MRRGDGTLPIYHAGRSNRFRGSYASEGFRMNRWLWIGMLAGLLAVNTGCLHHNTRGNCSPAGGCNATGDCGCQTGSCGVPSAADSCGCQACARKNGGLLGKVRGRMAGCHTGCGRTGCQAGPLGWQHGGLDYSSHLNAGPLGHRAPHALENQPFTPGPPSAQVAYPYYSHRGPRDFLLDNPPSIGP